MNRKIKESQRIIKEEKAKIKEEKKKIREKRFNKIIGKNKKEELYTTKEMIKMVLISLCIGIFLSFIIITIIFKGKNFIKLSSELSKFIETYETITKNYYGDLDKNKLIDNAIYGMLAGIDDNYTSYTNTKLTEEFNDTVNGTYEGIGCSIKEEDNKVIVVEVFKDSPSEKAGLKADDIILKVDNQDAISLGVTKLSNYIRTKESNTIELMIRRNDAEKKIIITRDVVELPSVTSKIIEQNNKKIGYIQISLFSAVANKQFKEHITKLEEDNIEGLVIDVRDNNGGYLTTVVDIVSELLPKGMVIYKTSKDNKITEFKDKTQESRTYPIAVLVNSASASASEILAASIKESYKGFVVGTKTFGKGTVQQVKTLSDGSMIKYTIENWLSPEGNWIDGNGVTPTHTEELSKEYLKDPIEKNDNQLQKALLLVSN